MTKEASVRCKSTKPKEPPTLIWQYFILRGQEPWSHLQDYPTDLPTSQQGACQSSDMSELEDFLKSVTNSQTLADALAAQLCMMAVYRKNTDSDIE